jgi:hypothetical protein
MLLAGLLGTSAVKCEWLITYGNAPVALLQPGTMHFALMQLFTPHVPGFLSCCIAPH